MRNKNVLFTIILAFLFFGIISFFLYWQFVGDSSLDDLSIKIQESKLIQTFRVTQKSSLEFALSSDDKEFKIESYLEINPKTLQEFYNYGLHVELITENKVIWQNNFYERTKKTLINQPGLQKVNEPAFYLNSEFSPTDSRLTFLSLPILEKTKKYLLKISLTPDSYSNSGIIRLARIKTRSPEEALRAWKYVDSDTRDKLLGNILVSDEQSRRDIIIKLMSQSLEYLVPEGKLDRDFYRVNLYVRKNLDKLEEIPIQPGGYLIGNFQTAVYSFDSKGLINISAKFKDGSKVTKEFIETTPKLDLETPVNVLAQTRYLIKNISGKPVFLTAIFQPESTNDWVVKEPLFDTSSYYFVSPNSSQKILADISTYPEIVRLVTRSYFLSIRNIEEKTYTVFFKALDANNQVIYSGKYQAESAFETLDIYNDQSSTELGEAVGRRQVAYLYLPKISKTLEIESDSDILVSLSTKINTNTKNSLINPQQVILIPETATKKAPIINEEICNQPNKTLFDNFKNEAITKVHLAETPPNWFSFRPTNFRELSAAKQYKLVNVASNPDCVAPIHVGMVTTNKVINNDLEGVSLRPEKLYSVEVFEVLNNNPFFQNQSKQSKQLNINTSPTWETYWYSPFNSTKFFENPEILGHDQDIAKLKFQLEKNTVNNKNLIINSNMETTSIETHTLAGKVSLKVDKSPYSYVNLNDVNQNDKFFVNRPPLGEKPKEIWSEKNYFPLTKSKPLSITIENSKEVISGVNFTTRFIRNNTNSNRVKLKITVENQENKTVLLRVYSVLNSVDKNVIFSTRPDEEISLPQRIFIPLDKISAKNNKYKIIVEMFDNIQAYGRFFNFAKAKGEPKEEINFWVEAKE